MVALPGRDVDVLQPGVCEESRHGESLARLHGEESPDDLLGLLGHHVPLGAREGELTSPDALHDRVGGRLAAVRLEGGLAGQHGVLEGEGCRYIVWHFGDSTCRHQTRNIVIKI